MLFSAVGLAEAVIAVTSSVTMPAKGLELRTRCPLVGLVEEYFSDFAPGTGPDLLPLAARSAGIPVELLLVPEVLVDVPDERWILIDPPHDDLPHLERAGVDVGMADPDLGLWHARAASVHAEERAWRIWVQEGERVGRTQNILGMLICQCLYPCVPPLRRLPTP